MRRPVLNNPLVAMATATAGEEGFSQSLFVRHPPVLELGGFSQDPCPVFLSTHSPHPGPHSACPGNISSSYSIGVQIEVWRDALEVQAVGGRLPAPEPPARSGAEWPTEVEAEELLAVAAVGQTGVALRDGPGCHANGVLPEVGHEEQEEGQGGEDDVRADEERGGGHGGSCVLPRVAGG